MEMKLRSLLIFGVAIALSACNKDDEPSVSGEVTKDFSLTADDGSTVKLADHKNKVVVLFFFGNDCSSCKSVAPEIESQLNAAFAQDSDYAIFGLDQWDGNLSAVQAFKATSKVTFPLLLKASGAAKAYEITYDRIIVLDKDGNIAFQGQQNAVSNIDAVVNIVNELLGK